MALTVHALEAELAAQVAGAAMVVSRMVGAVWLAQIVGAVGGPATARGGSVWCAFFRASWHLLLPCRPRPPRLLRA